MLTLDMLWTIGAISFIVIIFVALAHLLKDTQRNEGNLHGSRGSRYYSGGAEAGFGHGGFGGGI
jgi:hypothetical protein